ATRNASNTVTVLELKFATARSGTPSRLKSPTATDSGFVPTAKVSAAWKVPLPLPSSTETLLEVKLATARSCTPSLLRLPTATARGRAPTTSLHAAWNVTSPLPQHAVSALDL